MAFPVSVWRSTNHSTAETRQATTKATTMRQRQEDEAEIDAREAVRNIDRARVGVEGGEQRILDHDRQAESDEENVLVLAMARRRDDEALRRVARGEEQRGKADERDIRIDAGDQAK